MSGVGLRPLPTQAIQSGAAPAPVGAELAADTGLELLLLGMPAAPRPVVQTLAPRASDAFALDPNAPGLGFAPRAALSEDGVSDDDLGGDELGLHVVAGAASAADPSLWWVDGLVQPGAAPPAAGARAGGAPFGAPVGPSAQLSRGVAAPSAGAAWPAPPVAASLPALGTAPPTPAAAGKASTVQPLAAPPPTAAPSGAAVMDARAQAAAVRLTTPPDGAMSPNRLSPGATPPFVGPPVVGTPATAARADVQVPLGLSVAGAAPGVAAVGPTALADPTMSSAASGAEGRAGQAGAAAPVEAPSAHGVDLRLAAGQAPQGWAGAQGLARAQGGPVGVDLTASGDQRGGAAQGKATPAGAPTAPLPAVVEAGLRLGAALRGGAPASLPASSAGLPARAAGLPPRPPSGALANGRAELAPARAPQAPAQPAVRAWTPPAPAPSTGAPAPLRTFDAAPWLSAGQPLSETPARGALPAVGPAPALTAAETAAPPAVDEAGPARMAPASDPGQGSEAPAARSAPSARMAAPTEQRPQLPEPPPQRPTPESPAPLPARVELSVRDGDAHIQVAVSREDHGYAVELRAPRELVPELRALRAELESALSGEGEEHDGLASFHAGPDDGDADDARPEDQEGWRSAGPEDDQARRQQPNPTARKRPALINRPVPDPARLLDRRA